MNKIEQLESAINYVHTCIDEINGFNENHIERYTDRTKALKMSLEALELLLEIEKGDAHVRYKKDEPIFIEPYDVKEGETVMVKQSWHDHNGEGERSELCYRDGNIFREVDDHSFFVDVYSDDLTCVIPTPKDDDNV